MRQNPQQPTRKPAQNFRILLVVLILALVGTGTALGLHELNSGSEQQADTTPEATPSPSSTQAPAICRAAGEFVAGFMSPQADDADTLAMLETMGTDAVTFGGRIVPVDAADYPVEVAEAIGGREAYEYTVTMNWEGIPLAETDVVLEVGDTAYGVIDVGGDSVVVTESANGVDLFHSLTRVANQLDTNAYIGLPVPAMRTSGETWLPDNSYANVVDAFNQKFVAAYQQRGADGWYLAMEMPLTHVDHWNPVTDYYARQTSLITAEDPGATVLISPYLEGRIDRETITPDVAARGYEKLLGLADGTRVIVSPQDGLGVGTTALAADESTRHHYTVEEYFAALHEVDPVNLYVTIEAMRPGGGSPETRQPTTRQRVEAQLDATDPYVQGAIGFQWVGPNAMSNIPHIGHGACAAEDTQLP